MRNEIQMCPNCDGAINVEDNVEVRIVVDGALDRTDRFVVCDFCGIGKEKSIYPNGHSLMLDFHRKTEPTQYGKFLGRLEAARVA